MICVGVDIGVGMNIGVRVMFGVGSYMVCYLFMLGFFFVGFVMS